MRSSFYSETLPLFNLKLFFFFKIWFWCWTFEPHVIFTEMHIMQSRCYAGLLKSTTGQQNERFQSPVPGGASEKGSQTTPGITALREPTLSLVLKRRGWGLPFLDVVLSKKSDAEREKEPAACPGVRVWNTSSCQACHSRSCSDQNICLFICVCVCVCVCVCCSSLSPLHSIAVQADACPSTKRGIPRHKQ